MIYTGYFSRLEEYISKGLTPVSIAGWPPEFYDGIEMKCFAPSYDIFSQWKSGRIDDNGYVSRYILERLEVLSNERIQELLRLDNPILLCYEKTGFCHRHVLSAWLRSRGIEIEEY